MGKGNQHRPEAAQCIFLSQDFCCFSGACDFLLSKSGVGSGANKSRGVKITSHMARLKSHSPVAAQSLGLIQRQNAIAAPVQPRVTSHLVESRPNSVGLLRTEDSTHSAWRRILRTQAHLQQEGNVR